MSGSQRVHDPEFLIKRATEKKIAPESITDYVNAFRHGAPPHAGGGIGLERVVMFYLGKKKKKKKIILFIIYYFVVVFRIENEKTKKKKFKIFFLFYLLKQG